jgi:hypothetical protein
LFPNDLADVRDSPGGMYHCWTFNHIGVIFDIDNVVRVIDLCLEDPVLIAEYDFHVLDASGTGNVIRLQLYLFDHIGHGYLCKIAVIEV